MNRRGAILIEFSTLAALLLGLTSLPVQSAYAQATQWTWNAPVHTTCDGFNLTSIKHSSNTMAFMMSAPFIKVSYPNSIVLVDQPGNGGCVYVSYPQHNPHRHDLNPNLDPQYSYVHATWHVGGCPVTLEPPCYKYDQRNAYYNSEFGKDPRFRHLYWIYGPGFSGTYGFPQYSVFFRIDVDLLGSGGDSFQRKTSSGTWETATTETSYTATSTGTVFRVRDSSDTTKYLDISVPTIDNVPKVWVLRYASGQTDPTGNTDSGKLNEPGIWMVGPGNPEPVNGYDIVYWYKTYVVSSSTTCTASAPCLVGPSVYLRGGI
ncbi:MAG: hypothetical protein ACRD5H_16490 [Nitrososphaerales archaeon]